MLSECLHTLTVDDNKPLAAALLVQTSKAVFQSALDGGGWETAMCLWPNGDMLATEEFAGDEIEMERVHGYRKAASELRTKVKTYGNERNGNENGEEERQPGDAGGATGGKGGRRRERAAAPAKT